MPTLHWPLRLPMIYFFFFVQPTGVWPYYAFSWTNWKERFHVPGWRRVIPLAAGLGGYYGVERLCWADRHTNECKPNTGSSMTRRTESERNGRTFWIAS